MWERTRSLETAGTRFGVSSNDHHEAHEEHEVRTHLRHGLNSLNGWNHRSVLNVEPLNMRLLWLTKL